MMSPNTHSNFVPLRREIKKWHIWLLAWLLAASTASAQQRPNILLIVSDDQGWPDLGCMGLKPIETPNLDRLAARGVRGSSFYVTWPACTPSRGSILTGRYPQRNGLYDMIRNDMVNYGHRFSPAEYAVSPEMTLGLDVREKTIGDLLRQAGYRTGVVGKWDMGQARRFLPLQRGFDFFYGHGNNGIDYYTHERYGIHSIFRNNHRSREDQGQYITDVFAREAKDFVTQNNGQPWFLYLCFNAPHSASSFSGDDTAAKEDKVGVQAPPEDIARQLTRGVPKKLAAYYAALARMDQAIGSVLESLDATQQTNNTLVLFLSDNGGSGNGGNQPLRGQKSTMWEGGLRVPLIATWPGVLPPGQVNNQFLSSLELFPTIASAAQAQLADDLVLDGFDMLPVLQGKTNSARQEMFWQRREDRAARIEHWKWVESSKGSGLFDLATDPEESTDLTAARPEIAARLKTRFDQWHQAMEAADPRGPFRDY
jgi:arylsulfatase A-like enzyme